MNHSFSPPAGFKHPGHRGTRPALTNCCYLSEAARNSQAGVKQTRMNLKVWSCDICGPAAQTMSACDTISLSAVSVPHADLQTVVPLLIWEQGMKWREHQRKTVGFIVTVIAAGSRSARTASFLLVSSCSENKSGMKETHGKTCKRCTGGVICSI